MKMYEFSTCIKNGSTVTIPDDLVEIIPTNSSVSVILVVEETEPSTSIASLPALESLVAEIKASPSAPSNIEPASGLLAEHLASSPEQPDSSFDVEVWNQMWDSLEDQMDTDALADEIEGQNNWR